MDLALLLRIVLLALLFVVPAARQAAPGKAAPTADRIAFDPGPPFADTFRKATGEAEAFPLPDLRAVSDRRVGIPPGTALRPYDGPCEITEDGTRIVAKAVRCDLVIRARDVEIRSSKIDGSVGSGGEPNRPYSFSIIDSEVNASPNGPRQATAVGEVNFRLVGSDVRGGNRSVNCAYNCLVSRSRLHGQDTDTSGRWHESAIRIGEYSVIVGNVLVCDAPDVPPDAGCSASLTGYGDFAPVRNAVVASNVFLATTGGFCAYGGSTKRKPFSNAASDIVFRSNLFQRGPTKKCGSYGAITDFDPSKPGHFWIGNRWDDGSPLGPG